MRRGLLARGIAAAALLAIPVAVAAAIGFEGSVSGLTSGLGALASGPDADAPEAAGGRDGGAVNASIVTVADSPAGGGATGDVAAPTGGSSEGSGGGGGGDIAGPVTGVTQQSPQEPRPTTGGGSGQPQNPVLPGGGAGGGAATGGTGPVGQLLEGVNQTLQGLLGGSGQ